MDLSLILSQRYKDSQWILDGENYDGLTWLSDTTQPSKEELESQWNSVLSDIENEKTKKAAKKAELLNRLGLTEEEAKLLLG